MISTSDSVRRKHVARSKKERENAQQIARRGGNGVPAGHGESGGVPGGVFFR